MKLASRPTFMESAVHWVSSDGRHNDVSKMNINHIKNSMKVVEKWCNQNYEPVCNVPIYKKLSDELLNRTFIPETLQFSLSDLKIGDLIVTRDQCVYKFMTDEQGIGVGITSESMNIEMSSNFYNSNMTDKDGDKQFDIILVYRPTHRHNLLTFDTEKCVTVFKRATGGLTRQQIADKFGIALEDLIIKEN